MVGKEGVVAANRAIITSRDIHWECVHPWVLDEANCCVQFAFGIRAAQVHIVFLSRSFLKKSLLLSVRHPQGEDAEAQGTDLMFFDPVSDPPGLVSKILTLRHQLSQPQWVGEQEFR